MPVDFLCADFNRLSLLIGHFDGSNPAQRAMLVHELAGIHKQNCLQCRKLPNRRVRRFIHTKRISMQLDRSIFKAYDIRGIVGKTLTEDVVRSVGEVLGTWAARKGSNDVRRTRWAPFRAVSFSGSHAGHRVCRCQR